MKYTVKTYMIVVFFSYAKIVNLQQFTPLHVGLFTCVDKADKHTIEYWVLLSRPSMMD